MILKLYSRRVNSFSVQKLLHIPSHLLNIVIIIIIVVITITIVIVIIVIVVIIIIIAVVIFES